MQRASEGKTFLPPRTFHKAKGIKELKKSKERVILSKYRFCRSETVLNKFCSHSFPLQPFRSLERDLMKKFHRFFLGCCFTFITILCAPGLVMAYPDGEGFASRFTDPDNWEFHVASGVRSVPKYEGSDDSEAQFLFSANASFDQGRFFIGTKGIGIEPIRTERFKVILGIGYEEGRDESDDRKNLRGMGDVDDSFTGKITLAYSLDMIRFGVDFSTEINGDYGTTGELFADSRVSLTENLSLNWHIFSQWANDEHMENFFGINERQSLRSGKRVYKAEAGFKKIGIDMGLDYKLFRNLGVGVLLSANQLLGDAADSPLCRDETQLEGRFYLFLGF